MRVDTVSEIHSGISQRHLICLRVDGCIFGLSRYHPFCMSVLSPAFQEELNSYGKIVFILLGPCNAITNCSKHQAGLSALRPLTQQLPF